jgi:hypothetical protein
VADRKQNAHISRERDTPTEDPRDAIALSIRCDCLPLFLISIWEIRASPVASVGEINASRISPFRNGEKKEKRKKRKKNRRRVNLRLVEDEVHNPIDGK